MIGAAARKSCVPRVCLLAVWLRLGRGHGFDRMYYGPAKHRADCASATDRDAARVHTVQERLTNHLSADVARDYGDLKNIVQNFIVRQLDAARAISDEALRT